MSQQNANLIETSPRGPAAWARLMLGLLLVSLAALVSAVGALIAHLTFSG
jgi:hypothetical protein